MLRIFAFTFVSLGLSAGTALAQEAVQTTKEEEEVASGPLGEIALSEETIQLRYVDDGDRLGGGSRVSGAFFLSEDRDIVLSGDILFPASLGSGRLQINFGPRAYAALLDEENEDVLAVSLGAQLRYEFDRQSGFAIAGEAFYAPDVLTFGSADSLTDLSARLEVRLQERLTLFGGMRWFEFDLTDDGGTRTLQEELFAGIGWRFE